MNEEELELSLNVSNLITNAMEGKEALKELERAMESAQKKGDLNLYGKMSYEKDRLQAGLFRFNYDIKNLEHNPKIQSFNDAVLEGKDLSKFTADQEFMSILKNISDRPPKKAILKASSSRGLKRGRRWEIFPMILSPPPSRRWGKD